MLIFFVYCTSRAVATKIKVVRFIWLTWPSGQVYLANLTEWSGLSGQPDRVVRFIWPTWPSGQVYLVNLTEWSGLSGQPDQVVRFIWLTWPSGQVYLVNLTKWSGLSGQPDRVVRFTWSTWPSGAILGKFISQKWSGWNLTNLTSGYGPDFSLLSVKFQSIV